MPINDLRAHMAALEKADLLYRIDRAINKDTEMHPFVRWQYRGGIPDERRKAFLFTNVTGAQGERYENSVLIGAFAGSRRIYAIGMMCPVAEVGNRWMEAFASPVEPEMIDEAVVQQIVHQGEELAAWGGLSRLPVPISTPGYDAAPYLASAHFITRDPETKIRNVGHYRGQLKSPSLLGVSCLRSDAGEHWRKAKQRGEHLPVAIVVGAPPVIAYVAATKMGLDVDEFAIAGGLARSPIRLVKCKTVDLEVPADSEVVIEGVMRTDVLEPEGPFGESHGFIHTGADNPIFEVTAITHRQDYVWTSFISQVTPSESSTIKIVSYEPMFLHFLRDECGVKSVVRVVMHEPLTNIRPIVFLQMHDTAPEGEVWRALKLASSFRTGVGKIVIAVSEDINAGDLDAVMWSLAYRMTPHEDVQIVRGYDKGHGPPFRNVPAMENSVMLINATRRDVMPPVSLPKQEFMERALELWNDAGMPPVTPQIPWHGYSLGDWSDEHDETARLATTGRWMETGERATRSRRSV
jgi:UbiD family decarboxylase